MSMKRFAKAAARIGNELISRTVPHSVIPRIFPKWHNLGLNIPFRPRPVFHRYRGVKFGRFLFRNRAFRPFSSVLIERGQLMNNVYHLRRFRPLVKIRKNRDHFDNIKYLFGTNERYNESLVTSQLPEKISAYDFGEFQGKGCNAAVYSARLAEKNSKGFNEIRDVVAQKLPEKRTIFNKFPYAIKMMFNYEGFKENELWRYMGAELAAYPKATKLLKGHMRNFKPLPKNHPNVVNILTAFVDSYVDMPEAKEKFPEARPDNVYDEIPRDPKSLYIVMKRYRQTMFEYVQQKPIDYWNSRVMMAQLLEACTYLHENKISQRDMKSDNILLHYDYDGDVPHLVIADFGCALAVNDWNVKYESIHTDLGGNARTRAPEISRCVPGENVVVNFEMADTWAAGGLCYEAFTCVNPFYSTLDSKTYSESKLPKLSENIYFVARNIIKDLLKINPEERAKPNIAANAANLSLFRFGHDVRNMLEKCGITETTALVASSSNLLKERANQCLNSVMDLISAETMVSSLSPDLISKTERQLRATFLSRINRDDIWKSLSYFFPTEDVFKHFTTKDVLMSAISNLSLNEEQDSVKINKVPYGMSMTSNGVIHRIRSLS